MKKLIPPFLFLISIIIMILLDRFMPVYTIFNYPVNMIGIAIIFIGLAIGFSVRKQSASWIRKYTLLNSPVNW